MAGFDAGAGGGGGGPLSTGLVIGKLWPLHAGHSLVIEAATRSCARVVVIICDGVDQDVPAIVRARWVRDAHPAVEVLVADDPGDRDEDSAWWAATTAATLGERPIDAVFTSEAYGPRFAAHLGVAHVAVDPDRTVVPVSGRSIRADPAAHWRWLGPGPRSWYTRRVVVAGAESTGTTTIARALAQGLATTWVPEFGRRFWESKAARGDLATWSEADFTEIATTQQAHEDAAARRCGPVLVCDTDAVVTTVWEERYLGASSAAVAAVGDARRHDLYLLTEDDIPFVQDGTRDGGSIRTAMAARLRTVLAARPEPVVVLRGDHQHRLAVAVAAVEALLAAPGRRLGPRDLDGAADLAGLLDPRRRLDRRRPPAPRRS